jgi:hypothetical protein
MCRVTGQDLGGLHLLMSGIYGNGISAASKPGVANAQPHQADSALSAGQVYRAPFSRVLDGLEFWVEVRI